MMPSTDCPRGSEGLKVSWKHLPEASQRLLAQPAVPAWGTTQSCLLSARACGGPVGHLQEAEKELRDPSTP